ncbi:MAG: hypothetical protein ACTSRJ_00785 [Candidatus Hodarchaeales archaeon]
MASIAVKTNDMRFYNKILKLSQNSSLKIHFFPESQQISEGKYDIVVTTSEKGKYEKKSHVLYLDYENLNTETIPKIIGLITRNYKPKFQKMLIGIDPGEHIGIAAICDGMVLSARTVSLEQLINSVETNLLSFPSENVCIKIGDQPPSISKVIFNKLFDVFRKFAHIQMEIVPEADSSAGYLKTQKSLSTDEKAAIVIGLRNGKLQTHMVRTSIPEGRVKEIQNWSREKSGNLTIDSKLARLVAIGEITLEEAISIKSRKKIPESKE